MNGYNVSTNYLQKYNKSAKFNLEVRISRRVLSRFF